MFRTCIVGFIVASSVTVTSCARPTWAEETPDPYVSRHEAFLLWEAGDWDERRAAGAADGR